MKIGQVATLLGMPVETIRFYEKNQILSPGRRENSTYRDFEVWEIFNLFDCMNYRGYGFSVKDVKRIMKDASLPEISEMIDLQLRKIRQEKAGEESAGAAGQRIKRTSAADQNCKI